MDHPSKKGCSCNRCKQAHGIMLFTIATGIAAVVFFLWDQGLVKFSK